MTDQARCAGRAIGLIWGCLSVSARQRTLPEHVRSAIVTLAETARTGGD